MIYMDMFRHGYWGTWAVRPDGKELHEVAKDMALSSRRTAKESTATAQTDLA
jgi:hypothetical protein